MAKTLANRLKKILPKVISPNQGAFIVGRSITDNVLLSYEVLHYLHRKSQGKVGYAALKVDMAKAYDRVEWKSLEKVMLRMGFHDRWVTLIMQCITSVKFNILHDGKEIGLIIP